jgi:hypothetical protein
VNAFPTATRVGAAKPSGETVDRRYQLLAFKNGFGSVYRCREGCIHVNVGRVAVAMSEEEYTQLVEMIHTSAANLDVHRRSANELAFPGPDEMD